LSAFFDIVHQDPVLSQVKLIAEPWDLGDGGYQVGQFPVLWAEWNGRYRDTVRRFWRGDGGSASELATRLAGSSDLYELGGRRPHASINFVTTHDGFTLRDLVSYDEKHNEANLEHNQDGESHNSSWNGGVEGPTDDPAIRELRARQMRNLLATLLLSQGVPMLSGGDEVGRTQQGNNNAFCHDNELSWTNWSRSHEESRLLRFTRKLIRLKLTEPVLQRRRFFQGRDIRGAGVKDIVWLEPSGEEMSDAAWQADLHTLGILLHGDAIDEVDRFGQRIVGSTLLILLNADAHPVAFTLPALNDGGEWVRIVDTARDEDHPVATVFLPYALDARALAVLRRHVPHRPMDAPTSEDSR